MKVSIVCRGRISKRFYIWLKNPFDENDLPDRNFHEIGWHHLPIKRQDIVLIETVITKFKKGSLPVEFYQDAIIEYQIAEISDELLLTCDNENIRQWAVKTLEAT